MRCKKSDLSSRTTIWADSLQHAVTVGHLLPIQNSSTNPLCLASRVITWGIAIFLLLFWKAFLHFTERDWKICHFNPTPKKRLYKLWLFRMPTLCRKVAIQKAMFIRSSLMLDTLNGSCFWLPYVWPCTKDEQAVLPWGLCFCGEPCKTRKTKSKSTVINRDAGESLQTWDRKWVLGTHNTHLKRLVSGKVNSGFGLQHEQVCSPSW